MKYVSFFLLLTFTSLSAKNIGITSKKWTGRLGDNIFYVNKCLMLSYKYNLDFYYRPFDLSDNFVIHTSYPVLTEEIEEKFKKKIVVQHEIHLAHMLKNPAIDDTLFIVNFDAQTSQHFTTFSKKNHDFKSHIKKLWSPVNVEKLQTLQIPKNIISVAIHVRKGSFIDGPLESKSDDPNNPIKTVKHRYQPRYISDRRFPEKFPPDKFYIDAVQLLSETLHHQPLYVYVFTDYAHPQIIVEYYKQRVNLPNIIWAEREPTAHYKDSVIEDLYNMSQFDCIIRPDSYFSRTAELVGNPKIVLYPLGHEWKESTLSIKKIGIKKYGEL